MKGVYKRDNFKDYALYKGDEFICLGTVNEIHNYTGIPVNTIRYYASKSWARRQKSKNVYIAFAIDEEEENEQI